MSVTLTTLHTILIALCCCLTFLPSAQAAVPSKDVGSIAADAGQAEYRTPLAGEPYVLTLLGEQIVIPPRDRANQLALTLGGTFFSPAVGNTDALPFAALYWRRESQRSRTRLIFGLFVNELDHALKYGRFELLGHLENNTVPFPVKEIENGREVKQSSIVWGQAAGWIGAGYHLPVAPFQVDNDLRIQVFYEGGYLYSRRTAETGTHVVLPPDTYVHGLRLRTRYDGMRRNILELLHKGFAGGMDVEWGRRVRWSDATYGGTIFSRDATQEYIKLSGYLIAAMPLPGLSEQNRLILSLYGGAAPDRNLDRFSAFRIGGGPFPNESDDLARSPYPGAQFNQFPVSDYVLGTVEYRRELLAFLYLHLRGTFAWANRDVLTSPRPVKLDDSPGKALSVGLTSGCLWNSSVYLEYSHDDGILRNGTPGDSVLALWSKSF